MKNYMIIANVGNTEYLSKVAAESSLQAEHMILDRGICGRHGYAVEGCMAYDEKMMKTDAFIGEALFAEPITIDGLMIAIDERNAEITRKDAAEEEIRANEKLLKDLEQQIAEAKNRIEIARRVLREI